MFVLLRETRPASIRPMPVSELVGGFAVLLRERAFTGYTLAYSFISGATFIFVTIGAALFNRLFGLSVTQFGVLWSSLAAAYVLGAASAGSLARRHGSRRVASIRCGTGAADAGQRRGLAARAVRRSRRARRIRRRGGRAVELDCNAGVDGLRDARGRLVRR